MDIFKLPAAAVTHGNLTFGGSFTGYSDGSASFWCKGPIGEYSLKGYGKFNVTKADQWEFIFIPASGFPIKPVAMIRTENASYITGEQR